VSIWGLPVPVADVDLLETGAFTEADLRQG
jgi:hypothetical protein